MKQQITLSIEMGNSKYRLSTLQAYQSEKQLILISKLEKSDADVFAAVHTTLHSHVLVDANNLPILHYLTVPDEFKDTFKQNAQFKVDSPLKIVETLSAQSVKQITILARKQTMDDAFHFSTEDNKPENAITQHIYKIENNAPENNAKRPFLTYSNVGALVAGAAVGLFIAYKFGGSNEKAAPSITPKI